MRPTCLLLQHTARITLFSRSNCSLCETAKSTIDRLAQKRSFDHSTVDIIAADQTHWRDLYEFDAPVVHVERVHHTYSKPDIVTEPRKLFHRFTEEQLEGLIEEAEGHS